MPIIGNLYLCLGAMKGKTKTKGNQNETARFHGSSKDEPRNI